MMVNVCCTSLITHNSKRTLRLNLNTTNKPNWNDRKWITVSGSPKLEDCIILASSIWLQKN
jgi:uncharacterized membrane protein SirB2